MKRALPLIIPAVCVLLVLSSCDAVVSVTEAMGKNIFGYDETVADDIISLLYVLENPDVESFPQKEIRGNSLSDVKSFYYTYSDGDELKRKELLTLGIYSGASAVGSGNWLLTLVEDDSFSSVTSMLVPHDTTLITALLESTASDYARGRLSEKVDDEKTLAAAKGSLTVLRAFLSFLNDVYLSSSSTKRAQALYSISTTLIDNIDRKGDSITMGDVIVLDVITNICMETSGELQIFLSELNTKDSKLDVKSLFNTLLDDMNDFLYGSVELLNDISSTTGIFSGVTVTEVLAAFFVK